MADSYVGGRIFEWLIDSYLEDIFIVFTTNENNIYDIAKKNNISCFVFKSTEETLKILNKYDSRPDLGFLLWWPKIIKKDLLTFPNFGFINTHPSLLPYNRGKHPNFWAIVEEAPFGVSLHFVEESIDSGDILAQSEISYNWEDTGGSLYEKAIIETIDLFKRTYPSLRHLRLPRYKKNKKKGTFHLAKELETASKIELDNQYRARDLLNLIRARTFSGYPSCWFEDGGKIYEVRIEIKRENNEQD